MLRVGSLRGGAMVVSSTTSSGGSGGGGTRGGGGGDALPLSLPTCEAAALLLACLLESGSAQLLRRRFGQIRAASTWPHPLRVAPRSVSEGNRTTEDC